MELKTLKEIQTFNCYECDGNINPEELKREAVKWVKARGRKLNRIDFMKFFNLGQEDLA